MSFTTLYEKYVASADVNVSADSYAACPIEIDGVAMSIKDARKVRKALKKATKAAERYQRSR